MGAQEVYIGKVRFKKRWSRTTHQCCECGGTIPENEEYYQKSEREGNELTWKAVCHSCYKGPTLQISSKKYKYMKKQTNAKSDFAKAAIRHGRTTHIKHVEF